MEFVDAGPESAVPPSGGLRVMVDGRAVAVFRGPAGLVAFDDVCPHAGAPLSEGVVREGHVVCAWHGFRFDARTGACPLFAGAPSATVRKVQILDGRVLVAR